MTQDGLIEANHRLLAERDEARARVAELERMLEGTFVAVGSNGGQVYADALRPLFDAGLTLKGVLSLPAEVARLTANNAAMRETIAELEARLEALEDGEPEETPFDWIDPTVHAEVVKGLQVEIDKWVSIANTNQQRAILAQAISGALLKVLVSAERQDEMLGSVLVSITERMVRK